MAKTMVPAPPSPSGSSLASKMQSHRPRLPFRPPQELSLRSARSSCSVSAPEVSAGLLAVFGKSHPSQHGTKGPTCPNLGPPLELMSGCVPSAGWLTRAVRPGSGSFSAFLPDHVLLPPSLRSQGSSQLFWTVFPLRLRIQAPSGKWNGKC